MSTTVSQIFLALGPSLKVQSTYLMSEIHQIISNTSIQSISAKGPMSESMAKANDSELVGMLHCSCCTPMNV